MDLFCWRKKKKSINPYTGLIDTLNEKNKKFLDSVIKQKAFDVSKIVECGFYGGSVIVKNKNKDSEVKVQILKKEYAGQHEPEWEKLSHRNLLPLLDLQYSPNIDSYLFYTSVEEINTLEQKMKDKVFKQNPQSLWKILSWLEAIADGVQYLHSVGYAHMSLESKNMIVTKEDIIKISNFHNLHSINSRTNKYGIPQSLRAPESFFNSEGTWPVKPQPFESWAFAILLIELFTDFYISKKVPEEITSWTKDVYPVIYDLLKKYKFERVVRKSFPKAAETVDLKIIRYLAAYTLSFDPSKRPPMKQLHYLLIMLNLQKNFFSKISMEFKKDKIWESKIDQKKIHQLFMSMAIEDNLQREREENLYMNKREREQSIRTRSVEKVGKKSEKGTHITAENRIEIDSTLNTEKFHGLVINNIKRQTKKEKKILLKNEDKIKMNYTAFTFHNRSAYESALYDITSANSELSGVCLDEKKNTSYTKQQSHNNIENIKLNVGDTSPRREIQQNIQDRILCNRTPHPTAIFYEVNDSKKVITKKSEKCCEESTEDNNENEKRSKNIFGIGKQMMQNLIKWSFEDYESSSPNNYLHNLSKRLTK